MVWAFIRFGERDRLAGQLKKSWKGTKDNLRYINPHLHCCVWSNVVEILNFFSQEQMNYPARSNPEREIE